MHEGLEKFFASLVSDSQSATDLSIEDLRLLDSSGDMEKLDERVQVLDGIDAVQVSLAHPTYNGETHIGVPVKTQRDSALISQAAWATLVLEFRIV